MLAKPVLLRRRVPQEAPGELTVTAKWLYELVDQDKAIAQELVELDPKNPYSRLALAYRCYFKDDLEQAFEIIKEIAQLVELDDLEWLARLSRTNYEAFIVYSYVYSDVGSLIDYFTNQMHDRFNNERDEIYHNLAVRLYFEGHFESALNYLEFFQKGNDHTESQILRYLIGEKIGNEEMMSEAFMRVLVLTNNALLVDDREFFQDQLFILG